MTLRVAGFRRTARFDREFRAAPADVQRASADVLRTLQANPASRVLRLHALKGFGKPSVYKIDVLSNHSWQISFELEAGGIAKLGRLAPHKRIDSDPACIAVMRNREGPRRRARRARRLRSAARWRSVA